MEREVKTNKYFDKISSVFKRKTVARPDESISQQFEEIKGVVGQGLKETEWLFAHHAPPIEQGKLRAIYLEKKFEYTTD